MAGTTWVHRLARVAVRPLVGTRVTPNDLTTLRLATGLLACAALWPGDRGWDWWAGWLWLLSAFLDRADGELARLTDRCTPGGHRYDLYVDFFVNSAIFAGLGIGLGHSDWGGTATAIGLATAAALFVTCYCGATFERLKGPGVEAYPGVFGFDFDDLLFLLAPIIWLGWNAQLLVAACLGTTVMLLLTGWRLWDLLRARGQAMSPEAE